MDHCLNHEILQRYARQLCSVGEAAAVEAHIAKCEPCRKQIDLARADGPDRTSESAGAKGAAQEVPKTQAPLGREALPTLSMPQPSEYQPDERPGRAGPDAVIEGYQILEELPQGGQAVVYKAIHKATKAKVALKVLLPSQPDIKKARQYFKQEVELAASLNHPNIVPIRDSGISQGQYYFAMNYIHGQPLDRHLQSKILSIREKLILFSKICDAVAHAHQRGVIHRDLKPSNILVDERDEPHILDFGLAKTAANLSVSEEGTVMPTITGQIKGTVAYMSPEQAAGRSDLVDVRADVYSLGMVL